MTRFTKKDQPNKQENRNLMVAVVISLIILAGFHFFYERPRIEAERARLEAAAAQTPVLETAQGTAAEQTSAPTAPAQTARLTIETPALAGTIALRGAQIDGLQLKDYGVALNDSTPVQLLSPVGTEHPYYGEFGWLASPNSPIKLPTKDTVWSVARGSDLTPTQPVVLTWNNGQGQIFEKEISVDEHFLFTIKQSVRNTGDSAVTLFPYGLVARHGLPSDYAKNFILHEGPVGYLDGSLKEADYDDLVGSDPETFTQAGGWAGFTDKYWLTALIPDQKAEQAFRFTSTGDSVDTARHQTDFRGAAIEIVAGETASVTTHFFAGAKKLSLLQQYEQTLGVEHLDLAIDFGWFYFITKPFFLVLDFLYGHVGNFGIAIIIFTILLRLCLYPLASKSFRSMAKMKVLAPKLEELKAKYGNDREKFQKAIMELYQKEQVNPFGGCLPILLQIPIFFALYKVLFVTIEMRHAPFYGWIQDLSQPDPTSIFNAFGFLPWDVPSFLMIGAWPCLMCLTLVLQHMLNPKAQDPIQRNMMLVFPFFITVLLAGFPAGLVIYWTCSNIFSIAQQYVITKRIQQASEKKKRA